MRRVPRRFFEFFRHRWRIILLSLLAWSFLAWAAAEALIVGAELGHADALVVLAGSSTYVERTRRAAELYLAGRAPKIILTNDNLQSGWSAEQERNPLFVERATDELKMRGVPADKIEIVPGTVTSTYTEAVALREYAAGHNLKSLLVVTSAYQSRRALWTLRRVFGGSDVTIGLDAVAPGEQTPRTFSWWWHKSGWELVPGEYLKMIYYRINY
ncbi:MAG TPA: YdcF family protein [Pyrinomonadaceae bacterium]|nr:YdcF family protein [Pyrinomonadaceae bacterium]